MLSNDDNVIITFISTVPGTCFGYVRSEAVPFIIFIFNPYEPYLHDCIVVNIIHV